MNAKTSARALTATVIVVGPSERLAPAAEALDQFGEGSGVRAILISEGEHSAPPARVTETSISISGLAPRFLNNAVAALRLSSLPAMVWWRGGSPEALDDLAELADRLVLDVEEPDEVWTHALEHFEDTAMSDLRWTRLTRWRSTLAHLFDLPQVLEAAASFQRLSIEAADRHAARLFAGWLRSRLRWSSNVAIEIAVKGPRDRSPALTSVRLEGPNIWISLEVKPGSNCLAAQVDGVDGSARIVPLGVPSLAALIGEELGVRTRDVPFEQALTAAREIAA